MILSSTLLYPPHPGKDLKGYIFVTKKEAVNMGKEQHTVHQPHGPCFLPFLTPYNPQAGVLAQGWEQ